MKRNITREKRRKQLDRYDLEWQCVRFMNECGPVITREMTLLEKVKYGCCDKKTLEILAEKYTPRDVRVFCEDTMAEFRCPSCNAVFLVGFGVTNFCGNCGQNLDWSKAQKYIIGKGEKFWQDT